MRRSRALSYPVVLTLVALVGAIAMSAPSSGAAASAPNNPLYPKQWGLALINAPQAWATLTGKGVPIGVVDTGVDLNHADLAAHVIASTNCIGAQGDPKQCHGTGQDDEGHGTHVAGIANAITGSGIGVAGMAPDARLIVAKALDSSGGGSVDDINAGIMWVVDHGAKVVNLSLGDPNSTFTAVFGTTLDQGIEYAWSKGAVAVLAAGNSRFLGMGSSQYGNLDAVVVGAVGRDGTLASYSSPTGNAKWAILAPGGSADGVQADDILSTYWVAGQSNQYGYLAGTSMATPFVAGTLALLLGAGLTPTQAVGRLLSSVNTSVSCGSGSTNCHGLLAADKAVAGLSPTGPSTTTTLPKTTLTTAASTGPTSSTTATTTAPTTTASRTAPAPPAVATPPTTVHAAPPAVMVRPSTHGPAPAASGSPAGTASSVPPRTPVAVGLAVSKHDSQSTIWFVALAAGFVLLVLFGLVRVMRAPGADAVD